MFSIRGKRKRPSGTAIDVTEKSRKHGRRMKRPAELAVSKNIVNVRRQELQQQSQYSQKSTESSLSLLEQVPNELLQQIFFQCFEINLPRASLCLGQALSTQSTFNILILFAYFDDDMMSPVETRLFLPAVYSLLRVDAKMKLQRELLNCRWCTRERIDACLPILGRLAMLQAWHRERRNEEKTVCWFETNEQSRAKMVLPDGILREIAPLPRPEDEDSMIRHFFAQSDLGSPPEGTATDGLAVTSFKSYLPRIIPWDWTFLPYGPGAKFNTMAKGMSDKYSTLGARVLPNWLVRGSPWTQGNLELLQLLRQGSRFIGRETVLDISAAAVFEGMASAIKERHIEALLTLLELHNAVFVPVGLQHEISLAQHPRYLPTRLFHLATEAGELSSKIMWLLVRGSAESIPKDDKKLTAWALHDPDEGNGIAGWLLHRMSETNFNSTRPVDRFEHGHLWMRASTSTFPEAQYTFSEELNYLNAEHSQCWTKLSGDPCD